METLQKNIKEINTEMGKLNSEVGKLSVELKNINQKTGVVEETRTEQTDIKKLLSNIDRVMETSRKNQADIRTDMDNLGDNLQQVTSKIDEYVYRIGALNQRLDSIDVRLAQLSDIYKTTTEKGKKEDQTVKEIHQKVNFIGAGLISLQTDLIGVKTEINSLNEKFKVLADKGKEQLKKKDKKTSPPPKKKEEAQQTPAEDIKEEGKTPETPIPPQEAAAELPSPPKEPALTEPPPIVALKPEEVYKTAYSDYLKGSFQLAIAGFRGYIENFPDTELAGNSQYWIAECYYSTMDYEMAISEFNEVVNKYPNNTKVPSAMLKIAYSKIKLNKQDEAAAQLKEIIEKYPASDEARLAKERLKSTEKPAKGKEVKKTKKQKT
jgi:tol-pal system protein YbgF